MICFASIHFSELEKRHTHHSHWLLTDQPLPDTGDWVGSSSGCMHRPRLLSVSDPGNVACVSVVRVGEVLEAYTESASRR